MKIIISSDLSDFRRKWGDLINRQLPYAQMKALNDFGFAAQKGLRAVIPNYLDNPIPFTQRSPMVQRATKREVIMAIFLRDEGKSKGPALDFLRANVEGGQDKPKAIERSLKRRGILGSMEHEITGKSMRDRYGNLKGGGRLFKTLIQELQPMQDVPKGQRYRAGKARKGAAPKGRYFVGKPGAGSQPLGVWRRDGKRGLMPVLLFAQERATKKRFPFYSFVYRLFDRTFDLYMFKALDAALRTAR